MNTLNNFAVCRFMAVACLVTAQAGSHAAPITRTPLKSAAPVRLASATPQPQVYTIRYVFFTAMPLQWDAEAVQKAAPNLPPLPIAFQELQAGSHVSMSSTPDDFLNSLKTEEANHDFHLVLAGSVTCRNQGMAMTASGISSSDPRKFSVSDQFALIQTAPNTLTVHQTGSYGYTPLGEASRDMTSWKDVVRSNVVVGATYSQGIDMMPDGEKFVYAFSILPGTQDQTASAWTIHKTGIIKTAKRIHTSRRASR